MSKMKSDESGGSALHGSSSSKAASIFKNPFDVEKDQLIRQLFELPARMAAVVQSRRNQLGDGNADKVVSPFSIFAAKLAAREEMGAGLSISAKPGDLNETVLMQQPSRDLIDDMDWSSSNPYCHNKIDCAIEDIIKESSTYAKRKRKQIEHSEAAFTNLEYTSKNSADGYLCIDTTPQINFEELNTESQSSCKSLLMSANDEVFSSQQVKKLDGKCEDTIQMQAGTPGTSRTAKETGPVTGQKEVVPELPVSTVKMKPHDVAQFIIMVIRTLRHTRDSNMQKLFEILSVPNFPVEKCSFLDELIQQAHCYNKEGVAKELAKYRSQIMLTRSDS